MEALPAAPPRWALAETIIEPADQDEAFDVYWLRNGFTRKDIDGCRKGLTEQTLPLAHARMNHLLVQRQRGEFDTHVAARLLAAGGKRHQMPWGY